VEAGLGLDAAIARYAETADGPLAAELALLVTELRVGGSRPEAFRRFAARLDAPDAKSFVRAILHADQLGVSLAGTLRAQAGESRFRRQATVEEKANKAPVKMLFPTVLCIFPALFVVLLGPPVINLGSSL
jgi:tight adherence protein C